MQYIFAVQDGKPTSDHCQECGGEAYQGDCGSLSLYLVVDADKPTMRLKDEHDFIYDPPTLQSHSVENVCEFCAKAITERMMYQ